MKIDCCSLMLLVLKFALDEGILDLEMKLLDVEKIIKLIGDDAFI